MKALPSLFTLPVKPSRLSPKIMPVATISQQDHQSHSNSTKRRSPSSAPKTASEYSRNPDHVANTRNSSNEDSYVLTLHTEIQHHKAMTALRNKYFPKHINKLEAHIALFRALPGSKLSDIIIPNIHSLTSTTQPFPISASTPFRLKHGVALSLAKPGSDSASLIHRELKSKWEGFLSKQDNGGFQAHYTIQNKVDDERMVEETMEEVQRNFKGSEGVVDGLSLWRYDRGYWRKERDFLFREGK